MTARDRIVVLVVAVLAGLAGFWFFVVSPKRGEIAAADAQLTAQQQRLETAQALLANAQGAKRRFPDDYAAVTRLGKAVPADDDMASLVYQLQSVAAGAKVTFRSIKLAGSSSGAPAAAAPSATSTPPSSTGSSASTSGATATAAPATQVSAAQLPPGATVGTAGLATMPFTFIFEGSFLDMQRFLARVNRFVAVHHDDVRVSGRLLSIDGISLTTSTDSAKVKASIAATAYLSPDASSATASSSSSGTATTPSTTTPSTTAPSATAPSTNATSAVTAAPAS